MKKDELYSRLFGFSIPTYYNWSREKRPIIKLINNYFKEEELIEFLENQNIEKIENQKKIENLNKMVDDLLILMTQEEIKNEIQKIMQKKIIDKIITKFKNQNIKENMLTKILNSIDPNRPILFLYYICQYIVSQNNNKIENYRDFLIEIVEKFPCWNIFVNEPIFTSKIKKKFVETIKYKMEDDECIYMVNYSIQIINLLENEMPINIIKAHKNKFKNKK